MQICVHLDSARLFRWHLALLQALREKGHDPFVSFVDTPEPLPTSLTVLFDYDRARAHIPDDRFSTHLAPAAFANVTRYAGGDYGLMLDLSSASHVRTHPGRVLRPLYDGSYKDYVLFQSVLEQQAPHLAIADSVTRDFLWPIGRPAIETPWRPSNSMDMITSRLIEGLVRTVDAIAAGQSPPMERSEQTGFAGRSTILASAAEFTAKRTRRTVSRAVEIVTSNAPKWHVAWRRINGQSASPAELELAQFRTLDDGGRGYFADPFVLVHDGITHVFVEEVPRASGRGVISHFTLSASGDPSTPHVVLDTGSHLSYPYVFAHLGEIYMLPESTAAGGLDLYRATRFPDAWEKVARLIGEPLHDATPFEHEGRWWIAAGTQTLQSSSWDALSLYFADDLLGPWHPHPLNPVLIDSAAARPAGALWRDATGALMRPAQDCAHGYGSAITLRRILRLDPETFQEETAGTIGFEAKGGIKGPHTLSRGGGFELIDLFAQPSRLRSGYRS